MQSELSLLTPDAVTQLISLGAISPATGDQINSLNGLGPEPPLTDPGSAPQMPIPAQAPPQEQAPQLPTAAQVDGLQKSGHISPEFADKLRQSLAPEVQDVWPRVLHTENPGGDPEAVSPKGAIGLSQLMPATGAEQGAKLGIPNPDLRHGPTNDAIGSTYLNEQFHKYGSMPLALMAYNWGPGNVDRAIAQLGTSDPKAVLSIAPAETQEYVAKNLGNTEMSAPAPTGFDTQKEGVMKGAAAGMAQAAEEAGYHRQMIDEQERLKAEQAAKELHRQEVVDDQARRVESALNDYSSSKLDPNHFWTEKSTGERVLAGIAIALSSIGQGLQAVGGIQAPNMAMKVIQDAIDKDIEAQKFNIGIKRDKLQAERGILDDMRARFGDERAAEAATRLISLDIAKQKVAQVALNHQGQQTEAAAQQLFGQIQQEQAKWTTTLAQQANERANQLWQKGLQEREFGLRSTEASQAEAHRRTGEAIQREELDLRKKDSQRQADNQEFQKGVTERELGLRENAALRDSKHQQKMEGFQREELDLRKGEMAARPNPARDKQIADAVLSGQIDPSNLAEKDRERLVPLVITNNKGEKTVVATGGLAGDATDARELRDRTSGYVTLRNTLKEIRDLREKVGGTWESMDMTGEGQRVKAQFEALRAKAVESMKQFGKLGTLDAGVERLAAMGVPTIEDLLATSYKPGTAPQISKLDQALNSLDEQYKADVASHVLQFSNRAEKAQATIKVRGGFR